RDAGTRPPPSTRSSSSTPVGIRSDSSVSTSTRRSGARGSWSAPPRSGTPRAGSTSSTIVPKAPQPGQRPSHLPDIVPHSLQQWVVACLDAVFATIEQVYAPARIVRTYQVPARIDDKFTASNYLQKGRSIGVLRTARDRTASAHRQSSEPAGR